MRESTRIGAPAHASGAWARAGLWAGGPALVAAGLLACALEPEPAAPAASPAASPGPAVGLAPARVVVLDLHSVEGEERRLVELRGLVAAQLEAGLGDLPGVVPLVENVPIAPGLAGRLEADAARWRLAVRVDEPEAATLVVSVELCDAAAACTSLAETVSDDPTPATAALLKKVAGALGVELPAGARWDRTPSADRYARLILGRAAATWYRLLPPVAPEQVYDRRFDPIERAVFIDPRMSTAHWMAGRRRFESRDWAGARNAFSRAGLAAPERLLHLADEAAALEALGQLEAARSAWDAIAAKAPGDARFVLPRARVLLAMERTSDAVSLLDGLGPRFQSDPRVLALRVAIAERVGGRPEDAVLLERWQQADPTSPEPVRRRIALMVHASALEEAWALLPELARRGAADEAAELRLALATSLGRLDEAAAAAQALGQASVASAVLLRAGLERGDPPAALEPFALEPMGRLAVAERFLVSGDAARALRLTEAVRVTEPWLPEALVLRARALDALGRAADADAAWARAREADPAWARTATSAR